MLTSSSFRAHVHLLHVVIVNQVFPLFFSFGPALFFLTFPFVVCSVSSASSCVSDSPPLLRLFKIILANIKLETCAQSAYLLFLLLGSDLAGPLLLQPKRELISHTSANGGAGLVCLFGASVQRDGVNRVGSAT